MAVESGCWPEPTKKLLETNGTGILRNYLSDDVGFMFVIGRNDIFMMTRDIPRRLKLSSQYFKNLNVGDQIRNYQLQDELVVFFPYNRLDLSLISFNPESREAEYFEKFSRELSEDLLLEEPLRKKVGYHINFINYLSSVLKIQSQ